MTVAASVLLLGDDESARRAYAGALARAGYAVREAEAGEAALELARESPPDLAVLDLGSMPMLGSSVARALRGDPRTLGVRIVMLSPWPRTDLRAFVALAWVDAYVQKPVSAADLIALVRRTLRAR